MGQDFHVLFLFHFFKILNILLISFFSLHCIIPKGNNLLYLYLILPRSNPSLSWHFWACTLLRPFPMARTVNNQVWSVFSILTFTVVLSLSAGDFVTAPFKSHTLLCCCFFNRVFSDSILPFSAPTDLQQWWAARSLLEFISLFLYSLVI